MMRFFDMAKHVASAIANETRAMMSEAILSSFPSNGADTSIAAANAQTPLKNLADRQAIFEFIASQGAYGATCDEVEASLGLIHQSCSPRVHELQYKTRDIVDSGARRKTRSGRNARVFIPLPSDGYGHGA